MSLVLEVKPEKGFLRVHVAGDFSILDAKDIVVRMFEAIALHNAARVLVDCSDVKGNVTIMDHFEHSTFVSQELSRSFSKGVPQTTRFAYVLKPPLFGKDSKFAETVAVNRGVNVLTTDNMEEALKWLGVGQKSDLEKSRP